MITKTCECGVVFEYEPPKNYPDNRKYCNKCADRKKAEWDAKQGQKVIVEAQMPVPLPQPVPVEKVPFGNATGLTTPNLKAETGDFQSTVWNHQVRPHSSEMGPAGNRHKIYWETVEELKVEIRKLVSAGLMEDPYPFIPEHVPHD